MGLSIAHGVNGHRVPYIFSCKDTYGKWSVNKFLQWCTMELSSGWHSLPDSFDC